MRLQHRKKNIPLRAQTDGRYDVYNNASGWQATIWNIAHSHILTLAGTRQVPRGGRSLQTDRRTLDREKIKSAVVFRRSLLPGCIMIWLLCYEWKEYRICTRVGWDLTIINGLVMFLHLSRAYAWCAVNLGLTYVIKITMTQTLRDLVQNWGIDAFHRPSAPRFQGTVAPATYVIIKQTEVSLKPQSIASPLCGYHNRRWRTDVQHIRLHTSTYSTYVVYSWHLATATISTQ